MRSRAQRARRPASLGAALLALVRVLSIVLGIQLGGVMHAAIELAVDVVEECEQSCPVEGSCEDCPAGCPACHCPSAALRSLPASSAFELVTGPQVSSAAQRSFERTQAPKGPERPGIFRPPRTASALTS